MDELRSLLKDATAMTHASVVSAVDVLETGTITGVAGWGDATFNPTSGSISVSTRVAQTAPAQAVTNGGETMLSLRLSASWILTMKAQAKM